MLAICACGFLYIRTYILRLLMIGAYKGIKDASNLRQHKHDHRMKEKEWSMSSNDRQQV